MSLLGHYWTIAPRLRHGFRPLLAPAGRAWETSLVDPLTGRLPVTGWLREREPVPRLEVRWVAAGGHVSFPQRLDVGLGNGLTHGLGVDAQVLGWLRRQT